MITIKKLKTLKPGTLRRKTAVILQAYEQELLQGMQIDKRYLSEFLVLLPGVFSSEELMPDRVDQLILNLDKLPSDLLIREINGLRHEILKVLGAEPADWDLSISHAPVNRNKDLRGAEIKSLSGVEIYLDDLRSPFNIGSIFRTSEAFGVSKILLSPDCPSPEHPRSQRSSMGCVDLVSWESMKRTEAFAGKTVFALELGGEPIESFNFPEEGIAVIGSEELGVSPEARAAAEKSGGLVSIPVHGLKGSINVSVAFGIMMQRWSERLLTRPLD